MASGTIKKLVQDKGFGFIKRDGGEKDLFFHATGLLNCEFDALSEGDTVEFEIGKGEKGPRAEKVKLLK